MHESGENYLKTILILKRRNGFVRAIDIAKELEFSKPSVSRAVGLLKTSGYVMLDEKGHIELTELGIDKAEEIYERHQVLTRFLMDITGVPVETAEIDACKMEHIICEDVYQGIKEYLRKEDMQIN